MFTRAVNCDAQLWLAFSGPAASEKTYHLWAIATQRRDGIACADTEREDRGTSAAKPEAGWGGAHAE